MRTDWVVREELSHLLAALMPENRLIMEICLDTGLRISDVLELRTDVVVGASEGRFTVRERKTGKNRRVRLPKDLQDRAIAFAGKIYVFENRRDYKRHKTRQAVYKDMKRVAAAFKIKLNVAPHSARKSWAVEEYAKDGDLKRVQKLMNHDSEAVTMLYAMADEMTSRRLKKARKGRACPVGGKPPF